MRAKSLGRGKVNSLLAIGPFVQCTGDSGYDSLDKCGYKLRFLILTIKYVFWLSSFLFSISLLNKSEIIL